MPKRTVRLSAIGIMSLVMGVLVALSHPAISATDSAHRQAKGAAGTTETLAPPQTTIPAMPRDKMSPMHREIFAALDQEKVRVDELNARTTKNMSAEEFLALQQQIEEAKKSAQISVLEIQLKYAQTEGRQAQVSELSEALELIRHPLSPAEAVKRLRTQ